MPVVPFSKILDLNVPEPLAVASGNDINISHASLYISKLVTELLEDIFKVSFIILGDEVPDGT